ncbi:hypothetical protein SLS62_001701 [Diatrype stigma]|uniref:Uncharacterized protein n=1 Tax=Diatrype stigma TaxID=117547 RepID=A0AAN9V1Q5_9PEZI
MRRRRKDPKGYLKTAARSPLHHSRSPSRPPSGAHTPLITPPPSASSRNAPPGTPPARLSDRKFLPLILQPGGGRGAGMEMGTAHSSLTSVYPPSSEHLQDSYPYSYSTPASPIQSPSSGFYYNKFFPRHHQRREQQQRRQQRRQSTPTSKSTPTMAATAAAEATATAAAMDDLYLSLPLPPPVATSLPAQRSASATSLNSYPATTGGPNLFGESGGIGGGRNDASKKANSVDSGTATVAGTSTPPPVSPVSPTRPGRPAFSPSPVSYIAGDKLAQRTASQHELLELAVAPAGPPPNRALPPTPLSHDSSHRQHYHHHPQLSPTSTLSLSPRSPTFPQQRSVEKLHYYGPGPGPGTTPHSPQPHRQQQQQQQHEPPSPTTPSAGIGIAVAPPTPLTAIHTTTPTPTPLLTGGTSTNTRTSISISNRTSSGSSSSSRTRSRDNLSAQDLCELTEAYARERESWGSWSGAGGGGPGVGGGGSTRNLRAGGGGGDKDRDRDRGNHHIDNSSSSGSNGAKKGSSSGTAATAAAGAGAVSLRGGLDLEKLGGSY